MGTDLNVCIDNVVHLNDFLDMAHRLGIKNIVISGKGCPQKIIKQETIRIFPRINLDGSRLAALRKQMEQNRRKVAIIAVPLKDIDVANWAAEEPRVDILTVSNFEREYQLRNSTARLAVSSETALEIPIRPLITHSGLERSRILKVFRNAVKVAMNAGMQIVLSSGAIRPMQMRSASALEFIGILLGLERAYSRRAALWIEQRLARNEQRMSSDFIAPGIEITQRGNIL